MSIRIAAISATGLAVVAGLIAYVVINSGGESMNQSLPPLLPGYSAVLAEGEPMISEAESFSIAERNAAPQDDSAFDTSDSSGRRAPTTRYVLFTSDELGLSEAPVWVVSYDGVLIYGHAPGTSYAGRINVVIDAATGEVLSDYFVRDAPVVHANR